MTVTLLPEAVRGSFASGVVHLPAGVPQFVTFRFPATDWVNPGHTMAASMEISYDGGATWVGFGGFAGASSGGAPSPLDGLLHVPGLRVSWDGRACDVRGTVTVNAPFAWGCTVTTA